jgi:hypothetical protein
MNELIALQQTKADGRSTGAVRKQSRPMHAVRAPHPSRAHGFASIRPGVQRNERRPAGAWSILARAQACVVHRTTNRLRLKVSGHKHDEAFFASLQQQLLKQRGIVSVHVNPVTGSVVIIHDGTIDRRPEAGQDIASAVRFTPGKRSGDTDLASLAVEVVLAAITRELSSLLFELILIA